MMKIQLYYNKNIVIWFLSANNHQRHSKYQCSSPASNCLFSNLDAFSLQAFYSYQALYNTNLKVVFKPFRAIKPCIRLTLELLSLSIAQPQHCQFQKYQIFKNFKRFQRFENPNFIPEVMACAQKSFFLIQSPRFFRVKLQQLA